MKLPPALGSKGQNRYHNRWYTRYPVAELAATLRSIGRKHLTSQGAVSTNEGHSARDQALQTLCVSSITIPMGTRSPTVLLLLTAASTWSTHVELLAEAFAVIC